MVYFQIFLWKRKFFELNFIFYIIGYLYWQIDGRPEKGEIVVQYKLDTYVYTELCFFNLRSFNSNRWYHKEPQTLYGHWTISSAEHTSIGYGKFFLLLSPEGDWTFLFLPKPFKAKFHWSFLKSLFYKHSIIYYNHENTFNDLPARTWPFWYLTHTLILQGLINLRMCTLIWLHLYSWTYLVTESSIKSMCG